MNHSTVSPVKSEPNATQATATANNAFCTNKRLWRRLHIMLGFKRLTLYRLVR
jgi:hypothetical protein